MYIPKQSSALDRTFLLPPDQPPKPDQQFLHLKRICLVIIRPQVQPGHLVLRLTLGGKQQNGDSNFFLAKYFQDF